MAFFPVYIVHFDISRRIQCRQRRLNLSHRLRRLRRRFSERDCRPFLRRFKDRIDVLIVFQVSERVVDRVQPDVERLGFERLDELRLCVLIKHDDRHVIRVTEEEVNERQNQEWCDQNQGDTPFIVERLKNDAFRQVTHDPSLLLDRR